MLDNAWWTSKCKTHLRKSTRLILSDAQYEYSERVSKAGQLCAYYGVASFSAFFCKSRTYEVLFATPDCYVYSSCWRRFPPSHVRARHGERGRIFIWHFVHDPSINTTKYRHQTSNGFDPLWIGTRDHLLSPFSTTNEPKELSSWGSLRCERHKGYLWTLISHWRVLRCSGTLEGNWNVPNCWLILTLCKINVNSYSNVQWLGQGLAAGAQHRTKSSLRP